MQPDHAQIIALQALSWLATEEAMLLDFLQASGASPADLRMRAGDPDFQIAILEFLMTNDAWIVAFCDAHALAYTDPATARAALPGGETPHWT
ncbi:MAG: hypothetical protein B7Y02_10650 [Rhodobacterales bacterium 17-64-5]|nr:MAG: hypothetical protein B7Y02_10650 [Rhodobacterales bacterium 17-64-5]